MITHVRDAGRRYRKQQKPYLISLGETEKKRLKTSSTNKLPYAREAVYVYRGGEGMY